MVFIYTHRQGLSMAFVKRRLFVRVGAFFFHVLRDLLLLAMAQTAMVSPLLDMLLKR